MDGRGCQIFLTSDVSLLQKGYTPLYFASKNGHEEVVVLLLDLKADINEVHVHYYICNVSIASSIGFMHISVEHKRND